MVINWIQVPSHAGWEYTATIHESTYVLKPLRNGSYAIWRDGVHVRNCTSLSAAKQYVARYFNS